jgi:hypothetical protein
MYTLKRALSIMLSELSVFLRRCNKNNPKNYVFTYKGIPRTCSVRVCISSWRRQLAGVCGDGEAGIIMLSWVSK